jgi:integrase
MSQGRIVSFDGPTRDNTLLSRPTMDNEDATNADVVIAQQIASGEFAVTCKLEPNDAVRAYVEAGIAPATRRAYKADLEHFRACGGDIPTTDLQLAAYLAEQATTLKVATLTRRLAAISIAHKAQRLPSPVSSPLVRATMRGVRREHGTAQRQAAPLLREELFIVLGAMGDRLKDLRDRALLLIGFAGGLRRSELAAINLSDFERVREGIILTIRRSKTDQEGVGRKIGIPFGRTIHCPVRALENWLSVSRIDNGPVFRPVDRHGRVSAGRLSGEAVSLILRVRMAAAGFDPAGYSGHSLRAGFVTSGTRAGVSTFKIRQQTGHASDAMLSRYVRDGELFLGNAAGILL